MSDASAYAIDGLTPASVHAPATVKELAELVRACTAEGRAIIFFGGGTLQGIGNLPTRYDCAISLRKLDALLKHDPADLTVAVEAGMTIAQLDRHLAEHGRFVPLDAPRAGESTVGGALAAGWRGPRRAYHGRPRDLIIGASAVLNDGSHASSGGMVVKNATGYDLAKVYLGSLGTLGALVRVNFKTKPIPEASRLLITPISDDMIERMASFIPTLPIEASLCLIIRGFEREIDTPAGAPTRLALMVEGTQATLERATRDLRSELGAAGTSETTILEGPQLTAAFARILDAYIASVESRSLTLRSLGVPTTSLTRTAALRAAGQAVGFTTETITDLQTGDVIARLVAPDAESFRRTADEALRTARENLRELSLRLLAERAGTGLDDDDPDEIPPPTILAGGAGIRRELDAWGEPPQTITTMRALKERFDPAGLFAPGRFVGGL
jgi:glycolate oxidase FAD binding subunit